MTFEQAFSALTGYRPMRWQQRLFDEFVSGRIPEAVDLPTGLGKTSVISIWLLARALAGDAVRMLLPRRLVYVVDRRAVVDQATDEAEKLRSALEGKAKHLEALDEPMRTATLGRLAELKQALGLVGKATLPISTLRGQYADNRAWLDDPAATAVVVGTVDMTGSRLLFSGYGVSRKMRPFHAGLIGADTLLVLDEAHLVPPFEGLLRAITEGAGMFGPAPDGLAAPAVPALRLLSLSATGRTRNGAVFRLDHEDLHDPVVQQRLGARKRLVCEAVDAGPAALATAMAHAAWRLSGEGAMPVRVIVYCDARDTATKVHDELFKRLGGAKAGAAGQIELFVGARRVRERELAKERLEQLGFLAGSAAPRERPTFLVATSAGEVGVDLDADHMVCDLVPWERMVQRFGRVNRRGAGDATLLVLHPAIAPTAKKADAPTEQEQRQIIGYRALDIIAALDGAPDGGEGKDASPGQLRLLKLRAESDNRLRTLIDDATTPEPLRPALTRALVDAWSMTSLDTHTGRPEIGPWLRGWVEEEPQTTLVWRAHLPVTLNEHDRQVVPPGKLLAAFFEAAPPHASEMLETEAFRVVEWLEKRAKAAAAAMHDEISSATAVADDEPGATDEETVAPPADKPLAPDDIVLLVLSPADDEVRHYTLGALAAERKGRDRDQFLRGFADKTLVLDARFGGLADSGLLDPQHAAAAPAVDTETPGRGAYDPSWQEEAGFRVTRLVMQERKVERYKPRGDWRFGLDLVRREDAEGNAAEVLRVERFRKAVTAEEARSTASVLQLLTDHQCLAARKAQRLGELVGLSGVALDALVIAARLHDEGKAVTRWQRAFNAPAIPDASGHRISYAKTPGPINQQVLAGYRHEFGSLPVIERDDEFNRLPEDWRDLVLHLVAAHHGNARPTIGVDGADDAPPTALAGRAREVALRFARMQKRWGPWGLAWWESLLRAADQQASRQADAEGDEEGDMAGAEATNG